MNHIVSFLFVFFLLCLCFLSLLVFEIFCTLHCMCVWDNLEWLDSKYLVTIYIIRVFFYWVWDILVWWFGVLCGTLWSLIIFLVLGFEWIWNWKLKNYSLFKIVLQVEDLGWWLCCLLPQSVCKNAQTKLSIT